MEHWIITLRNWDSQFLKQMGAMVHDTIKCTSIHLFQLADNKTSVTFLLIHECKFWVQSRFNILIFKSSSSIFLSWKSLFDTLFGYCRTLVIYMWFLLLGNLSFRWIFWSFYSKIFWKSVKKITFLMKYMTLCPVHFASLAFSLTLPVII